MQRTVREVTDKWSRSQTVSGPYLIDTIQEKLQHSCRTEKIKSRRSSTMPPSSLTSSISKSIVPEERYRGIFKVIVYRAQLTIGGKFPLPDFTKWGVKEEDILWSKSMLNLGISDLRGIEKEVILQQGSNSQPFSPGVSEGALSDAGINLPMESVIRHFHESKFKIELPLKGSQQLFFVPLGKNTEVTMTSEWKDPSFTGSFLPEHDIQKDRFEAKWKVLHFNRNFPKAGPIKTTASTKNY
jgi:inner membrane protein